MTLRLGVVIGRFQPVHRGHLQAVLKPAFEHSDHVLILFGSANRAPSPKDPFDPETRFRLMLAALTDAGVDLGGDVPKVQWRALDDFAYSEDLWLEQTQRLVGEYQRSLATVLGREVKVTLFGARKDRTSYYVNGFPQWDLHLGEPERVGEFSATRVRELLYEGDEAWRDLVPEVVARELDAWRETEAFAWCAKEHAFYAKYRAPYEAFAAQMRHGVISVTVDAVVFSRGRVLLVQRKRHPGKGLWALPGGYLEPDELPYDGAVRECREETRFRLSRGWLFAEQVYAAPNRSLKGRVLTIGYGFNVPWTVDDDPVSHAMNLNRVSGGSDAAHAQWVPVSDVLTQDAFKRGMFEDHFDIVADMHRRLP